MKPTTYLLLLTLFFSACKKDDGEPNKPNAILIEHSYALENGGVLGVNGTTCTFTYYENGLLELCKCVDDRTKSYNNAWHEYDAGGRLITIYDTNFYGSGIVNQVTLQTRTYDGAGNLTEYIHENLKYAIKQGVRYEYENGKLVREMQFKNNSEFAPKYYYYNVDGTLQKTESVNGNAYYTYNDKKQVKYIYLKEQRGADMDSGFNYDDQGRRSEIWVNNTPNGNYFRDVLIYDNYGNLKLRNRYFQENTEIDAVVDYHLQYDEYGNLIYERTLNPYGEAIINSYKYEYLFD